MSCLPRIKGDATLELVDAFLDEGSQELIRQLLDMGHGFETIPVEAKYVFKLILLGADESRLSLKEGPREVYKAYKKILCNKSMSAVTRLQNTYCMGIKGKGLALYSFEVEEGVITPFAENGKVYFGGREDRDDFMNLVAEILEALAEDDSWKRVCGREIVARFFFKNKEFSVHVNYDRGFHFT